MLVSSAQAQLGRHRTITQQSCASLDSNTPPSLLQICNALDIIIADLHTCVFHDKPLARCSQLFQAYRLMLLGSDARHSPKSSDFAHFQHRRARA